MLLKEVPVTLRWDSLYRYLDMLDVSSLRGDCFEHSVLGKSTGRVLKAWQLIRAKDKPRKYFGTVTSAEEGTSGVHTS